MRTVVLDINNLSSICYVTAKNGRLNYVLFEL